MAQKYFDKFPIVTYSNTEVVDLTRRTAMLDKIIQNPYVFYPYEISENERPDQLSTRYYEDQYRSWIFYISNKIVDPYYEWYMSNDEFYNFIVKKYGDYYTAETRIKYYKNNWVGKEDISVSSYNALSAGMIKYWEPKIGSANKISGYSRKQNDWTINTNKILAYKVSNTSFINDEICTIFFDNYHSGKGQVVSYVVDTANTANSVVYLHHVSGDYYLSNTVQISNNVSYIYGHDSKVNTYFTGVVCTANNIPDDETIYWDPVTYLEYETDKNEFNKTIRVLDSDYKQIIADNLKDLLK